MCVSAPQPRVRANRRYIPILGEAARRRVRMRFDPLLYRMVAIVVVGVTDATASVCRPRDVGVAGDRPTLVDTVLCGGRGLSTGLAD